MRHSKKKKGNRGGRSGQKDARQDKTQGSGKEKANGEAGQDVMSVRAGEEIVDSKIEIIAEESAKMIVDSPKDGEEVPKREEEEKGERMISLEDSKKTGSSMDTDMSRDMSKISLCY